MRELGRLTLQVEISMLGDQLQKLAARMKGRELKSEERAEAIGSER